MRFLPLLVAQEGEWLAINCRTATGRVKRGERKEGEEEEGEEDAEEERFLVSQTWVFSPGSFVGITTGREWIRP